MMFRESTLTEVCKYLTNIDLMRLNTTCKPINSLVKRCASIVNGEYSPCYKHFTGLRTAIFSTHRIDIFPPNLTKLDTYCIKEFDVDAIPLSVTDLRMRVDKHIGTNHKKYNLPNIIKLDIGMGTIDAFEEFTQLEDLSCEMTDSISKLPATLTRLNIMICCDSTNLNIFWKALPLTLTNMCIYITSYKGNELYMRDLPLGLKQLSFKSMQNYVWKSNDYFNPKLQYLDIAVNTPFDFSRFPTHLTSLTLDVTVNIPSHEFSAALPRTTLHLTIAIGSLSREFYSSLPSSLLSLSVCIIDQCRLYPELLPKSLTKLQSSIRNTLIYVDTGSKFPTSMKYMYNISMETQSDMVIDLRYMMNLIELDVYRLKARLLLPTNLKYIRCDTVNMQLHEGLTTYINRSRILSTNEINDLPRSIEKLQVRSITLHEGDINYPPNLKELVMTNVLKYEELLLLPKTLTSYRSLGGHSWILSHNLDGIKWISQRE